MTLKEGMVPVDWTRISPNVCTHMTCCCPVCFERAEYMKRTTTGYRVYCAKHAMVTERKGHKD